MSSDARAWRDAEGVWHGSHDGICQTAPDPNFGVHEGTSLTDVLNGIEDCMDELRWEIEDGGPRGLMLFGWTA